MFGLGGMSNSVLDLEDAPFIFAIGTNMTESHPVIAVRVKRAVRKGAKLLVADPRRVGLVEHATWWLPMRVGSDVALLNAMAHVILAEGLERREFLAERATGVEELRAHLERFTPEWAAPITGLSADDIRHAARAYATAERAAICYTLGITEHACGVDNVQALGNLALLTGNLGRAHAGLNPLRGQNNVQGTGDSGALPESLPGYRKVSDPIVRAHAESVWGFSVPAKPGFKKPEVVDAILEGEVSGLWVMGDNTIVSDTDSARTRAAFGKLELLVSQDVFLTETARLAHVVLPAAAFAEVDGVYTSSERRVQRVRKALPAPGEAKADWWIVCEVGRRMGLPMPFERPEDLWNELRRVSPFHMGGISYARIERTGVQWPCPDEAHPGTSFLHDGAFNLGKAAFRRLDYRPPAEEPDADYPLILTTGRRLSTYHTNTQTGRVRGFERLVDQEYVEMNPIDADELSLADGAWVWLESRRGRIRVRVRRTLRSPRGTVFTSFAFGRDAPVNTLTSTAVDPVTKTPEFKACAVRVRPEPRQD